MFVYLLHSIMVADGSNQSISYAANFISVRLLSSSRIRRFLIFDIIDNIADSLSKTSRFLVVDELDDAFDAAENDDGDIDGDEFVDDREETVDGVERDGRDTTTDEPTTLAMVCFFYSPLRTTYRFLSSSGGFYRCLPCLRLMLDLWFLAKEWSSSLAHWKGVSSSHAALKK